MQLSTKNKYIHTKVAWLAVEECTFKRLQKMQLIILAFNASDSAVKRWLTNSARDFSKLSMLI